MLRALVVAANAAETGFAHGGGDRGGTSGGSPSSFETASFLKEWLVREERAEGLWPTFCAAANFCVNTAVPYDLHALKVRKLVRGTAVQCYSTLSTCRSAKHRWCGEHLLPVRRANETCRHYRSWAEKTRLYCPTACSQQLSNADVSLSTVNRQPKAESLLRSVAPPTNIETDEDEEHGSRKSIFALSRSVMRLLRLCESIYAPQLVGQSVLSGLTAS